MGPDDLDGAIETEAGPVGADRLDDAVGEQEDEVAGLQRDGPASGNSASSTMPSGRPVLARLDADDPSAAGRSRGVAGVGVDERPRGRVEAGQEQGDEAALVDVGGEGAVGQGQDVADPRCGQRQGPQVGPGRRHEQGRAEAVAADVADGEPRPPSGSGM